MPLPFSLFSQRQSLFDMKLSIALLLSGAFVASAAVLNIEDHDFSDAATLRRLYTSPQSMSRKSQ
jgi:hypothetical protein